MATRPGFIWSGSEWVAIGQEAIVNPFYYQATAPSTPSTGDIWIESDVDVPSVDSAQFLRWRKTMVGGETSLSGNDDSSLPLAYTPGYEQLYINGVLMVRGQDYTATTGTTVTGLTALTVNDVVEVFSTLARTVADVYTQTQSDAKYSLRNLPAFSAYASGATNIAASSVWTKVNFATEEFDLTTNYDTGTSRFTPTVAGYYQINAEVSIASSTAYILTSAIYKNASPEKWGSTVAGSASNFARSNVSALVYANGTTDYFEIYAAQSGASALPTRNNAQETYFQASCVRMA